MGEKDNKIVLKVDLECQRCYKKIRRVLCKIQDKMNIKQISFEDKSNTVTISGPFDADEVCRKLCCHAGRVIKDMNIVGKESKGGGEKAAAKPAEKEKAKDGKEEKPAEKKDDAKPGKEKKDDKPEKKVKFADGDGGAAPAADAAKPGKAIPKADIGPLLEKMKASMANAQPPPCGEPIAPQPVAQGVAAAHSIWPAPASSLAGYSYPSYDPSYYGGGGGYGGCGCGGYGGGYCRCGKQAATPTPPGGGYYGVPVYDNQGWYYGGRQPYYPQQQSCCEDPNAGCSVM